MGAGAPPTMLQRVIAINGVEARVFWGVHSVDLEVAADGEGLACVGREREKLMRQ